jgi:ADP-heptose:LPS heptosyltransferase
LNVSEDAQKGIEQILQSNNIDASQYLIVIHPGGNWDLKRWPIENFSRVISQLAGSREIKVVISGAHKDIPLVREINNPVFKSAIDLTGQTDLKQLMALMKRANLVISADSGPLHLANSVGCDVIGIFGPTRPEITGLRGSGRTYILQHDVGCNREPCYHLKCPDNICMQSISAQDVIETINKIRNS